MDDTDSKFTAYLLGGLALGLLLGGLIGFFYSKSTSTSGITTVSFQDISERNGQIEIELNVNSGGQSQTTSVFVPKIVVENLGIQTPPTTRAPSQTQPPTAPPSAPVDMNVLVDDDPSIGSDNAPVVIVEFSDFGCVFCDKWATETLPELKQKYIDTGKVRLVYRDFPLASIHPRAPKAAEASECADDQGKYWEYHDALFENREAEWQKVSISSDSSLEKLKQYAADLGLDTNAFDECLDSDKYADEVTSDMNAGSSVGVTGTPTFFINGQKLVGAQPFENFEKAIEAELA